MSTCVRTEAWRGTCGRPAESTNPPLCAEHKDKTCWCGAPAVRDCANTEGFVCGAPLCASHGCHLNGFHGPHDPEGQRAYKDLTDDGTGGRGPIFGPSPGHQPDGRQRITLAIELLSTVYKPEGIDLWLKSTHGGRFGGTDASGALLGHAGEINAVAAVNAARQVSEGNFA